MTIELSARSIHEARRRLEGVTRRTPLQPSRWLSERAGAEIHLKLECWQRTGSFKLRGAYNAVARLEPEALAHGLVTASAGNHGQAVALAARLRGATATVFVPEDAADTKKARIVGFGAELREAGASYDEAAEAAEAFATASGARYIHAFSDPAVVAGQGTVGLEILESLPAVREVVVPVGGGGLIAGVGQALSWGTADSTRVLGVQSAATSAMHAAFEASRVIDTPTGATLCDGLAGAVEPVSYERARRVAESMSLVAEDAVARAIRELYQREGVVAEGAGAVGVAAVLTGALDLEGPAVVIVSGGNLDADRLARILTDR